ncbi:MAG: ribonuclease R, partial [Clostridia bacterium]|nr:ribonuclease R [Clostridia bacterium]
MDRKERILAYITSKEYIPLKYEELKIVLDVPEEADAEFSMILSKLCREGKICLTKKDRYAPVGKSTNSVSGVLRCSAKGFFGFVICDDEAMEDIFVSGDEMHGALDGDRVIVKILSGDARDAHKNGRITKIIERANKTVVGVAISRKKGVLCVQADNRKIYELIRINEENSMEAIIGDRVAV